LEAAEAEDEHALQRRVRVAEATLVIIECGQPFGGWFIAPYSTPFMVHCWVLANIIGDISLKVEILTMSNHERFAIDIWI